MKNFGINGFGRIGRTAFKVWWNFHRDELNLRVINTSGSMEIEDWAHLIKYDSNYGVFAEPITVTRTQSRKDVTDQSPILGTLAIGDRSVTITAQRDPAKIPWGQNEVEVVIESTGIFTSEEKAAAHFLAGAKKVIISAPAKGGNISTSVIGVNNFNPENGVLSNASCTTNCVAPIVQIIHEKLGVEKAMMTTIHSYTDDQNLHDNSHKDMRRARAAAMNIVPTSTGAAITVTEIITELKGLFDGLAIRVPTPVGSISDMVFVTKNQTSIDEVNEILRQATTEERWKGIVAVTDEAIVSSDIIGRSESSIVDLALTNVIGGNLVKVVSWYDNEFGYCNRLVEQVMRV
ncbi:MAG: type I glyceraldehyde-3-phosphate dehydrogenase [Candidatus Pacebacteria bacterium CG_4_10_14_0_8_um_filter_43_12]|nr:MAG: type I glyceraldehyde-3-phosphate dehydrogenase [Candidatus Pacebacteria bacterium CG10_big_fil_rev_8_21_14_0_10_44_11]PIY79206.1 MAG: type I glyceraldehyde-3-phosphate dehydrogenase [Candidatus Pacebacteria bacterium CG_4_10_14_0_8_um_filter_43_12]